MKILCVGDSWTKGYGVSTETVWPSILSEVYGYDTINLGVNGLDNKSIQEAAIDFAKKEHVELIIIGWSGVTRYKDFINNYFFEFSTYGSFRGKNLNNSDLRDKFFKNITLEDILFRWQTQINTINNFCKEKNIKCIQFSVFGDRAINPKNFTEHDFLGFLAEKQNMKFKFNIPIFEFDFLSNINYDFVNKFAEKNNFPDNWKYAIIEREEVRPGQLFLPCGHPNEEGHKLWATYINEFINDKL
jgi:hypothetical protein